MVFDSNRVEATSSISITAKVGAPLPDRAAQITSPQEGESLSGGKTLVQGTCQPKMYITIWSNNLIGGGTMCSEEGLFATSIDLGGGNNLLTVQTNDGIDQQGPTSQPVKVVVSGPRGGLNIKVDKAYQRIGLEDALSWRVDLLGEASLYAVGVDWGDGTSDLLPTNEKAVVLSHKYQEAGARSVKITASDNQGNNSEISLVASVSSLTTLENGLLGRVGRNLSNAALYATVLLMVASFFVGNYYQSGKRQYVWKNKAKEITQEENYYLADSTSRTS